MTASMRERSCRRNTTRRSTARWWATATLLLTLCALLAGCGGASAAKQGKAGATATVTIYSTKGRGIPTATATPALPYGFPRQWQAGMGPSANTLSFAFMPSNPMVGFVCASSAAGPGAVQFFATHDGGATWSPLPTAPASNPVIPYAGCAIFPDQTNSNDVFVMVQDASDPQDTHGVGRLYRSQDGGDTWQKLALVLPGAWYAPDALAISGSRIVVTVAPTGEQNPLSNYLYASDDGGHTWKSVAPTQNGQTLTVSALMSVMGSAVIVPASAPAPSGNGASRPASVQGRPFTMPSSSGAPAPITYWRTTDGGVTWTQVQLPGDLPIFVRSVDGTSYYGLSLDRPRDGTGGYLNGTITPYGSSDGGATWKALPTFAGVENGYLDPTLLGMNGGFTLTPDGQVIAAAQHTSGSLSSDAGLFAIHLGDPSPTWQPLARSAGAQHLLAVAQNGQTRLWGLLYNDSESGSLASMPLS